MRGEPLAISEVVEDLSCITNSAIYAAYFDYMNVRYELIQMQYQCYLKSFAFNSFLFASFALIISKSSSSLLLLLR